MFNKLKDRKDLVKEKMPSMCHVPLCCSALHQFYTFYSLILYNCCWWRCVVKIKQQLPWTLIRVWRDPISHFGMLQIQFHLLPVSGKHSFYNEFFIVKGNNVKDFALIPGKRFLEQITGIIYRKCWTLWYFDIYLKFQKNYVNRHEIPLLHTSYIRAPYSQNALAIRITHSSNTPAIHDISSSAHWRFRTQAFTHFAII